MARFDFTFLGDEKLAKQLAELPEKLERSILARAIRDATRTVLLPAIRASTPVGRPYTRVTRGRSDLSAQGGAFRRIRYRQETGGRLRASLKVRALRRRKGRVGSAVQVGTRAQLGIQGRGFYPAHLEFGFDTARGNRRVTTRQRFMKTPLLASRSAWLRAVASGMRAGIEREVRP